MRTQDSGEYIPKKAFEIAYATMRVSKDIPDASFASHLTHHALALLDGAVAEEYRGVDKSARMLTYLFGLGEEFGIVHPENAKTIVAEVERFMDAVHGAYSATPARVDLGDAFVEAKEIRQEENIMRQDEIHAPLMRHSNTATEERNAVAVMPNTFASKVMDDEEQKPFRKLDDLISSVSYDTHRKDSANARQASIISHIRQSGTCRLRDLQEFLPDASERTIRYDLQSLMERDLLERVGNGGPATFYRAKQT